VIENTVVRFRLKERSSSKWTNLSQAFIVDIRHFAGSYCVMKKVTKRQPYSVPILMRALDILEFLRGSDIPLKPDEISNATGVSRTTTYRILHSFVLRGYVALDPEDDSVS